MAVTGDHNSLDTDWLVVGSGFGGSVAALRLAEKGYRVVVAEKGGWKTAEDFPHSNWNLKRWLWAPAFGWRGIFKITPFRHVMVLSGTGVGGGSLGYAATLPTPQPSFFKAPSWGHLADWQTELAPHYQTARRMLGVTETPLLADSDLALKALAEAEGLGGEFAPTPVGIYFGSPGIEEPDPYLDGAGPSRSGCTFCGACMIGCRHNAKNTLDKNYLHLAQKKGAAIQARKEVVSISPLDGGEGRTGYRVVLRRADSLWGRFWGRRQVLTAKGVVLAGGVTGTMPLLLKLQKKGLPRISPRLGCGVRTNQEGFRLVTTPNRRRDFSKGVAIGSRIRVDDQSYLEAVRYPSGSGFWRLSMSPAQSDGRLWVRLVNLVWDHIRHPWANLRSYTVGDWARDSQVLMFMQTLDSTLRLKRGFWGMGTTMEQGAAPTPFLPESDRLARRQSTLVGGKPYALITETLLGIPTTAHFLGGACMGATPEEGVIDPGHRVFGYHNLLVVDGCAISANPGVNPSLTILALAERAMSAIPQSGAAPQ
ncbi:MAG: GMC oxidoreductase [Deltaproteobacteria bacterium]|nr:GMC oxidoreductase [Deltaproteobacteria bacterium]